MGSTDAKEMAALHGMSFDLEPLGFEHARDLVDAAAEDPSLYRWSPVPQGQVQVGRYIDSALSGRDAGNLVPFAIRRQKDHRIIGSTRFWNIEHWQWPSGHPRHGRLSPDACEIGYTWLSRSGVRSGANAEAKFLMLSYAFESWGVLRVCLHTDCRNARSRRAIERIGGRFEGILRAHRMAADFNPRDSARYSILRSEWPAVKENLLQIRKRFS